MASKKPTESKKSNTIHKTAKNELSNRKSKRDKDAKSTGKTNTETRSTSNKNPLDEKPPNRKGKQNLASDKKTNEKTLVIDDEEMEGMTVPPTDQSSSPKVQRSKPEAQQDRKPRVKPAQGPTKVTPRHPSSDLTKASAYKKKPVAAKSPPRKTKQASEEDEDDEEEESTVTQFSYPAYKILSGASVAPVQIHPQKVVINQSEEGRGHWGSALTGLFQNSKLTLKLRMLRLLLIWIFFRVLNKQTAWLSDMLGIGIPDEEPPGPKDKPPPGERYIKVFQEGDPNPYHVRVKRPL